MRSQNVSMRGFEISHWEGHRPFAFPADEDADEQLGLETLPQEVT